MTDYNKIVILLILFFNVELIAQNNTIDKIGIGDGLSDHYILDIAQDEEGFMWFGTEWGLNRFDGNTFKVFKADTTENTISHNGINKILVDSERHLLWIATKGGGLNVFNRITEKFSHYPTYENRVNSTLSNGITDLCFDINGDIWIATYKHGLKKLDVSNDSVIHSYLKNIPLPNNFKIKCIADDHNGNVYIGHWGNGFSVLSTKDLTGKHYEFNSDNPTGLPGNEVMDICIDSNNHIWLGTHSGLAVFNPKTELFTVFKFDPKNPDGLSDDDIRSIHEINGQLWIGTWKGGVNILELATVDFDHPENTTFKHIEANDLPSGLSSPIIEAIDYDSYGNIWLGTYGEGINVINHIKPFFKQISYSPIKGELNGLSNKAVNCITNSHDSILWVGLGNGFIDQFNKDFDTGIFKKQKSFSFDCDILSLFTDNKGLLWIGNDLNGIMCYNTKKGDFENFDIFRNPQWDKYVASIYEDRKQNLWISTNNGVIVYDTEHKGIKEIEGENIGLKDNYIRNIIEDINGNFWIGSAINGVSVVTPEFELLHNFNEHNSLGSNNINYLYEDSLNQIWVCTNNGVTVFPKVKNQSYDSFNVTKDSGLADNYIRAVVEGKKGEIWITTNAGISLYNIHSAKVKNYSYNDGIPLGTFKNGAVSKTNDGTVFLGSQDGICYFNTNDSISNIVLPPIVITGFQAYDSTEDLPFTSINLPVNHPGKLTHTQNTLFIDFNVLDYGLRNQVEYAYLLHGLDEDKWYQTKMQNHVTFRNLPPGNYTFFVKARIHNQEWSDQTDQISFKIYPPIYLTWWAKCIYISIALLIGTAIVIFYRRKLKLESQLILEQKTHEQELETNKERIQFFTNITHELRTPLTLILGPLDDMIKSKNRNTEDRNKLSLIYKNAHRLLTLINQLLEFRKSETQSKTLNVAKDNISVVLHEIVFKFKDLNKNKDLSIDLMTEKSIVLYYDKEVITIIMDNLISNALKNTKRGNIKVMARTIRKNEVAMLEIEVSDTGYGIPESDLDKIFDRYFQVKRTEPVNGTGIGLALVKKLVELHEGIINVRSIEHQGTTFVFRLKLDETYPHAIHLPYQTSDKIEKTECTKRMLIVEDNKDIRDYISNIFIHSFEIITACDGQEALLQLNENTPDIIISDIMMPIMDGVEFCKQIKENIGTSHIPVILLTAKDTESDKTEGYSIGADSYITKPFSSTLLTARVNNLLKGREKIATYFTSEVFKKELVSNSITKLDNEFINQTISIIENNLGLEKIDIAFLAQQHNMSYSSYSRKIKAITGATANDFVRDIKLQKAEQLLISREFSISEVAFKVGYNSLAYFREAFKNKFGVLPSEYVSNLE
ncbi:hybrid sensor histidine kinase/response regulator transcription factor [Plebeiibacterium sediminum]|uniref:histidine kinase n=1 Tax=Plebeiibacterium sediminum TaxID=2992112 RepID=A0AAE3SH93_9BACT|nr:two-component regulator propeller domain-containing protein [Plebeiobacterium sediminum]MCW3789313.1 response regulator [Plebeiobacterium sediminum]